MHRLDHAMRGRKPTLKKENLAHNGNSVRRHPALA